MSLEAVGSISGLVNVWLTTRQNIWCWPVGLLYIFVSYVVFFEAHLYAELGTHTVYLILTCYGWQHWLKGGPQQEPLKVSRSSLESLLTLFFLGAGCTILLGSLLHRFTDNAMPYLDCAVAMMSFAAMWLQTQKKIENWFLWCAVNLISLGMYIRQEIYFYAFLYSVFFILALLGHRAWKQSLLRS